MDNPQLRLIYPQTLERGDQKAALVALKEFSRFGIKFDTREAHKVDAHKDVRNGKFFTNAANSDARVVITPGDLDPAWTEIFVTKRIIGVGVTVRELSENIGRTLEPRIGVGRFARGALVSTAALGKLEHKLRLKALETALKHELGHVFIDSKVHCENGECIMKENRHLADFIEETVRKGLSFCRRCTGEILTNVAQISSNITA
ncbi:hypothetical protein HY990_00130 [Candidatus Micrarchaeota archaeon]|nr:hypothetical protein [Candidatus Micrarchaeota archaeon]